MIPTLAIFLDAYRQLQSRKLFWIVLFFSGLCVAACAAPAIDEQGFWILGWHVSDIPAAPMFTPEDLYKFLFLRLGIRTWLTFVGLFLALVSTAGIFPDFLTGGAIDQVLSKPIGRLRLFLTKYAAGLLFVALQATVFVAASFLVIGLRGGVWEPGLFVAVPLVILFFSYLFAVCVFFGVWTRSTLAALLLTLVFWVLLGGLRGAERVSLFVRAQTTVQLAQTQRDITRLEGLIKALHPEQEAPRIATERQRLESQQRRLTSQQRQLQVAQIIHATTRRLQAVLPKTSDTASYLARTIQLRANLRDIEAMDPGERVDEEREPTGFFDRRDPAQRQRELAVRARQRELAGSTRSLGWILATSLGFEALVLAAAAWIFCRRDF